MRLLVFLVLCLLTIFSCISLVPLLGWAYNALTTASASSALDLAKRIQTSFLSETQGSDHRSPKNIVHCGHKSLQRIPRCVGKSF